MIYIQIATWTAFAILAVFYLYIFVLHVLLILNSSILQVHLAINRLGLSTISPFNPKERVALIILDLDMYDRISYIFIYIGNGEIGID